VLKALTLAFAAFAILAAGSAWLAFYPPVPDDLDGAANLDDVATRVRIPVAADSLDGWLIPGRGQGVIVLFHGYGRKHDRLWRYAGFLKDEGYTLLAVDFRSSRAEDRLPTTLGAHERADAEATWRWLRAQRFARDAPAGVFGESLGASVALLLAAERDDVAAVVADCPFATGARAIEDTFRRKARVPAWPAVPVVRAIGRAVTGHDPGAIDVMAVAPELRDTPVYFIHTDRDDRMAPAQARDLWQAAGAKDPIWLIDDAGHNEGWQKQRRVYEARIAAFFGEHLRGEPATTALAEAAR
jgi:dienelactone hydrolase